MDLIRFDTYPVRDVLKILLQDKTTKQNIIFATDDYAVYGSQYGAECQIDTEKIRGINACEIQPRVSKSLNQQQCRTRAKAEVFTPSWICNRMNNHCDEVWFERPDVFNTENETSWTVNEEKITFPDGKNWKMYVDSRRIEITCGEAPYIVSRYDAATGELIEIRNRIGILDRKLRIVAENAADADEMETWFIRALQSVYGYEYQGDNLLIARVNLLMTFTDYYETYIGQKPNDQLLRKAANIISWNIWQMDGLSKTIPLGAPEEETEQVNWFDMLAMPDNELEEKKTPICMIYDWRRDNAIPFTEIAKGQDGR